MPRKRIVQSELFRKNEILLALKAVTCFSCDNGTQACEMPVPVRRKRGNKETRLSRSAKARLECLKINVRRGGAEAPPYIRRVQQEKRDMTTETGSGQMVRALSWKGAFWVAAGVPPLVLFSIGGIAGTTGKLAFAVWMISML